MTLTQMEELLTELQQEIQTVKSTVADLQAQLAKGSGALPDDEDNVIDIDYNFTTDVPPTIEFSIPARIVAVEIPPAEVGLSADEWDSVRAMMELLDER